MKQKTFTFICCILVGTCFGGMQKAFDKLDAADKPITAKEANSTNKAVAAIASDVADAVNEAKEFNKASY